jgi:anti-anti-sigma factor
MTDPHELRVDVLGNAHEGFVVVVAGDIDLGSAPAVHERLQGLAGTGAGVVADLAGVTFIDSSGIHALLSSARAIDAAGGTLVLASPSPAVRRLLELVKADEVVPIEDERDVAITRARGGAARRGDG